MAAAELPVCSDGRAGIFSQASKMSRKRKQPRARTDIEEETGAQCTQSRAEAVVVVRAQPHRQVARGAHRCPLGRGQGISSAILVRATRNVAHRAGFCCCCAYESSIARAICIFVSLLDVAT
ncbi:hypothetical protein GUJ93_ZPchr0001g32702 [Zizania palustris]|uniref:Uncharacterized protein n=1 Tax=Zizania palustris TaxID=103762 RepID=A0A8J5RFL3_ZIZPA|nr:hypothetical protein GUJ93_ZPchr0001g32702 [Zizania palustris]